MMMEIQPLLILQNGLIESDLIAWLSNFSPNFYSIFNLSLLIKKASIMRKNVKKGNFGFKPLNSIIGK